MAFDFKKEYKEFYLPKSKPAIVTVPPMNYIAVRGKGDPNQEGGEYKAAVGVLYALAYTLKMSYKTGHAIEGFYEYVVPVDFRDKSAFQWVSAIRLPDFVGEKDFLWAVEEASRKKKLNCSGAFFYHLEEGLCVQMMHLGPYDSEPASLEAMDAFARENGYEPDISETRRHHEIYLSDPRKSPPEKWKTVLRHPIRKA